MVNMTAVRSSNIESIGYDPKRQELLVKFQGDGRRLYTYLKVPKLVWTCFQQADSKGRFLRECIIPYFQVTQDHPLVAAVSKKQTA